MTLLSQLWTTANKSRATYLMMTMTTISTAASTTASTTTKRKKKQKKNRQPESVNHHSTRPHQQNWSMSNRYAASACNNPCPNDSAKPSGPACRFVFDADLNKA
jgi:hypothetical protein